MPLWWSILVPSLNMIWLTVPELGRLQFSIDRQLKVPIFTFFGGQRGSYFKFNFSNPQKALPWRERRIMTYWALGCVQKCDLWAWLKNEKKDKLSCVKLAICPDHPRRHRPLKFCMRGCVREVVIYLKFHENRSRGLGAVGGQKSPSSIDKAHGLYTSLYYRTSRDKALLLPTSMSEYEPC